ncbi:carbonic anhydrase [Pyronema domesticum]|nr:carbonic anhydrase [Pyronema domesticum]
MSLTSANTEQFENSNKKYATTIITDAEKKLSIPPAKKYVIITCMDARIDPAKAFGVTLGDAHIIRNAGGSARDALRSLIISQQLLGTEQVIVVKHTKCGMLAFTNEDLFEKLGVQSQTEEKTLPCDFLPFKDLNKAVKEDIEFLKAHKFVKSDAVSGYIYDVESGRSEKVV